MKAVLCAGLHRPWPSGDPPSLQLGINARVVYMTMLCPQTIGWFMTAMNSFMVLWSRCIPPYIRQP